MSIGDAAGAVFRWVAGVFVPMFLRPTAPAALAWFLHFVLVAGAVVGLYFVQTPGGLTEKLGRAPAIFKQFWLPALFLLGYFLLWTISWLWRALAPNQPATDFPDLDEAWDEAVGALEKAGIGIADTPLFLVLGTPPAGYEPLFRALPHGLTVAGGTNAASPLRVYANRDGIYLALPGATLLGMQDGAAGGYDGGASVYQSLGVDQSIGIGQSVGVSVGGGSIGGSVGGGGGPLQEIQRIIRTAREDNRPLSDTEKERVRVLSGGGGGAPPQAEPSRGGGSATLHNTRLVDLAGQRLAHVCGKVAAVRWPLCPVNGAILAIPASAAEKDEAAQQWGLVARQDFAVAEAVLKLRFPVYALVGGVEDLPGGHLFFDRFAADKGGQRLGKGFPLNPELKPESTPAAVETTVGWVFNGLLPYWALRLTRVDGTGHADTKDNGQLVRFLAEIARRGPHLARLVSRAVVLSGDAVPVFGGCYLSVVTPGEADAKFAKEFFRKVESTQGFVAWTDAAFAEDAGYRSTAKLGYAVLALLLAGVVAFAAYVVVTKFGK